MGVKMITKTYKVHLKSAYNDFRIIQAKSPKEAKEIIEQTNKLAVEKVEKY